MSSTVASFGERLRKMRLDRGMTQLQLGGRRFTAAYVSQLESGKRTPSPAALKYFARRLDADPDELATGQRRDLEPELELRLVEAGQKIYRGEFAEAGAELSAVLQEARGFELVRTCARAEELLGILAERRGDTDTALSHFERAIELWADAPLALQVEAVAGIARTTHLQGDVRYAIHILETFLTRLKRQGATDPSALMRTYSSLVGRYYGAGMPAEATDAAREALRLAPSVDEPAEIASMHLNASRALLHDGYVEDALTSLRRARDLFSQVQRGHDAAYADLAQGIVLADEGRLDEARQMIRRALDALDDDARLDRGRALNELARVERLSGNRDGAEEHLIQAGPLLEDSNVQELAMNKRELGAVLFARDPQLAEKRFGEAIELYERTGNVVAVASTYRLWGEALAETGDLENAVRTLATGLERAERGR